MEIGERVMCICPSCLKPILEIPFFSLTVNTFSHVSSCMRVSGTEVPTLPPWEFLLRYVDDAVDKRNRLPGPLACVLLYVVQSSTQNNKHTDGRDALPGAVECLEELRSKGKRLVILSNTSKRESFTMGRLPKFGFRQELFDGGVTSGEVRWHDGLCGVCLTYVVRDDIRVLMVSACHVWFG